MAEINVTLRGVVSRGLRHLTAEIAEMDLYVTECIMHKASNATWNFPAPSCVLLSVRDTSGLSEEDKKALSCAGTNVTLHVVGNFNDYRIEVISTSRYAGKNLEDFLALLGC